MELARLLSSELLYVTYMPMPKLSSAAALPLAPIHSIVEFGEKNSKPTVLKKHVINVDFRGISF